MTRFAGCRRILRSHSARLLLSVVASIAFGVCPRFTHAADTGSGWGKWWLPPDRSAHGYQIDLLFVWTFWITMITFVAVELLLVVFLIRYRRRNGTDKAHFTHGNTRLEMCWTLAPAVIFIALAVANKGVWENLRFNPATGQPDTARILIIGEQFKWNVVYPGPDGKLGRYLVYPQATDLRWPDPRPATDSGRKAGKPFTFAGVEGPAFLASDRVTGAISNYIAQHNKLGKDFADPAGQDDNWVPDPGRAIYIPAHRPVEVHLTSKDVIHDFFLPNFRVKLDAVPGMRGTIAFTPTMTSAQLQKQTERDYTIAELERLVPSTDWRELTVAIGPDTPNSQPYKYRGQIRAWRFLDKDGKEIIRGGSTFGSAMDPRARLQAVQQLKEAGIPSVRAYLPGYWELVCEELCGQGHYSMTAQVYVLEPEEYRQKFETAAAPRAAGAGQAADDLTTAQR